jgi:hypothetical protein
VDQSLIVNQRTGQRMRFIHPDGGDHPVAPGTPQTLRIECWSPASEEREPNHTHPEQASGFEIISGELAFWVDGKKFRLANEGKLSKGGMPQLLHLPVLFRAFGREIRPTSAPWPLTRLTIAALAPVAALRGYHDPADL